MEFQEPAAHQEAKRVVTLQPAPECPAKAGAENIEAVEGGLGEAGSRENTMIKI